MHNGKSTQMLPTNVQLYRCEYTSKGQSFMSQSTARYINLCGPYFPQSN